jgi:hypothetical protein
MLRGALLAIVLAACGPSSRASVTPSRVKAAGHHVQIVRAMNAPERKQLIERLRARNPEPPGTEWTVNEEALATSATVVDPFAGFVRRARRQGRPPAASPARVGEDDAMAAARAFVKKNADLLGLPRYVVIGLSEQARSVAPSDHASTRALYIVRLEAPFPSKGYEGFKELENVAELDVFVDDDGEVSSFVNLSRVHPRLSLDTKPELAQSDPRLLAQLVGRKVFALALDSQAPPADVRTLGRIPLGDVQPSEVTHMQLVVHVSPGPQLMWMTYRLAYFVEIAKPEFFFFRYVVDADTGDVIEDSQAPFAPAMPDP